MKLPHPVALEDSTERFLITEGSCFITDHAYYYVGLNREQVVLHIHVKGRKYGESVFLDKALGEFMAVHALVDLLIEGMGTQTSPTNQQFHKVLCDGYVVEVGHSNKLAKISLYEYESTYDVSEVGLPYNRTGLEIATELLRLFK